MKRTLLISVLLLAMTLTACGQATQTEPIPTVQLEAAPSTGSASSESVIASAQIVPAAKVEVSFPLTGTIQTVDIRVGDEVTAGQQLASLNPVILQAKVAEAEANVLAADTQVRYLRRVGPATEQLNAARADLDRANAGLEMAKAMLQQATLLSPIDGTVVEVRLSPGETATPGLIVAVIGDLSRMQIETTDLSERDVPAVKVGQSANVFIEALNETFTGKVVDIARLASSVGGDTVYTVTVELDEQPQGLLWGMSAEVEIQTEQ
jgi:RND family efflux transporter MFP subunit